MYNVIQQFFSQWPGSESVLITSCEPYISKGVVSVLVLCPYSLQNLSVPRLLFLSLYLWGTILPTLEMELDWLVLRAGPVVFHWLTRPALFFWMVIPLSLLSLYGLVLLGWGLRTDKVSIFLSQPCITELWNNNNNNNNNNKKWTWFVSLDYISLDYIKKFDCPV